VQTESYPTRFSFAGASRPIWQARTITLLLAVIACAGFPGCSTDAAGNKDLLRRVLPAQPVISGSAVYAGGALAVECWLGPTVRLKKTGKPSEQEQHPEQGDHRSPDTASTGNPFKQGASNLSKEEINEMYGRKNYDNVLPARSALCVRFTNHGAQPTTFTIADVNSALGDFVPRPETLTVASGEQGSVDPMLSNRDDNFTELELTLTLKIGAQKETHIVKLSHLPEGSPNN